MVRLKDSLSNNLDLACPLSTATNGRMATTKPLLHRLRLHNRSAPAHLAATLSSTQRAMGGEKRFSSESTTSVNEGSSAAASTT
jgi:hypothetical protein